MWIRHLRLDGFGRFHDFELALRPRLNLILGPNDSGKTTLLGAVLRLLFGFGASQAERDEETARCPRQDPGVYGGGLDLVPDQGEPLLVTRDFSSFRVEISPADGGQPRFKGTPNPRSRNSPDLQRFEDELERLLGMRRREIFQQTVYVLHRDLGRVEGGEPTEELIRLISGAGGTGYLQVLEGLKEAYNGEGGLTRDPLEEGERPKYKARRMEALKEKLEELKTDLATVEKGLPEVRDLEQQIEHSVSRVEDLERDLGEAMDRDEAIKSFQKVEEELEREREARREVDHWLGSVTKQEEELESARSRLQEVRRLSVEGRWLIWLGAGALLAGVGGLVWEPLFLIGGLGLVVLLWGLARARVEAAGLKAQIETLEKNLRGKSVESLRERRGRIGDEIAALELKRKELLEAQPFLRAMIPEEIYRLTSEVDRLKTDLEGAREEEHRLRRQRADRRLPQGDPHQLRDQIAACAEELDRLRLRARGIRTGYRLLREVVEEFRGDYAGRLAEAVSAYFSRLTGWAYGPVELKAGEIIPSVLDPEGGPVPEIALGQAARDALYLALRLAMADHLAAGRRLPLLLDDPFVNFDQDRLEAVRALLEEIARDRQVVLAVHDRGYVDWWEPVVVLDHPQGL